MARDVQKVIWFTKGGHRKTQIYRWFNDVVIANNLVFFYDDVARLLRIGKDKEAFNRFAQLVDFIRRDRPMLENGDTLAYLIEENINLFGKTRIVVDLFAGIIQPRTKVKKVKIPKRIIGRDIAEIEQEVAIKRTRVFLGVNKQGKRERAVERVRLSPKGEPIHYLQSKKTGKILKQSKVFKKSVKKRQKDD